MGTSSNKYLAAIGGAFGWGLKRNVLGLYKFVCRNFDARDDIYGFGFSRGSFTIRLLVDFIATEGLVAFRSEEELGRNAAAAYRHYRSRQFPSRSPFVIVMRWLRDVLLWAKDRVKGYRTYHEVTEHTKAAGRANIPIRFLGLWDTVDAYGMPIDELKQGIDWVLWPMLFSDLILSPRVVRACHALALDDERTTFHPLVWDEVAEAEMIAGKQVTPGRITQVWFAGVHSNVGGGYPEDQLSLVSLEWMMGEAMANGLVLDQEVVTQVGAAQSPYARLYDSRAGIAAYYRYAPRQIRVREDGRGNRILPIIHGSVVMRMAYGSDHYAPISLPHEFWVLAPDGELVPMEGAPLGLKMDATKRRAASTRPLTKASGTIGEEKIKLLAAIEQLARPEREAIRLVWDTVFWRRTLYFVTVALTGVLVGYPWLDGVFTKVVRGLLTSIPVIGADLDGKWRALANQLDAGSRGPIASIVDAVSAFIPGYAAPWTRALEDYPLEFALIVGGIVVSLSGSTILQGRIRDRARLAWQKDFKRGYADWLSESQKGWRNGVVLVLLVAIVCLVLAIVLQWTVLITLELSIVAAVLLALLALRSLGQRTVSQAKAVKIRSTFALSLARVLRNNRWLRGIHTWVFERTVPIVFALLLILTGWAVANRALFDAFSAAGYFCPGSPDAARKGEKTGLVVKENGFTTDAMCWPSGLVLEEGRRYRITLTTPGDWFDRTIRADVAGFPANNLALHIATPIRRWWGENWFKPIARIGQIGNDEYALAPSDPFEEYAYPPCRDIHRATTGAGVRAKISRDAARQLLACAATPAQRNVLVAEIKARTTGELFLYVNDGVLMWPGATDAFVANNSGGALSVKVERITTAPGL